MEENTQLNLEFPDGTSRMKYKCKYCFRDLSSRQNLREHLYIHTGEKPYSCTEPGCGQSFRQGSLLSIHKRIHSEVKKSRQNGYGPERRCIYPKLTDLMAKDLNYIDNQEISDIEELKGQIGEERYGFIKQFINKN